MSMRNSRSLLQLLLIVATPSTVGAETTLHFPSYVVAAALPVVLLVCGLALLAVGVGIRKFRRTPAPEREFDDVPSSPTSPSVTVIQNPIDAGAEHSTPDSADLSKVGPAVRRADRE